ncbi:MAG: hypothetical protein ABIQ01_06045 [Pseudolysinimonas sp.]
MARFVMLYVGGDTPASQEEGVAVMAAWEEWFKKNADVIADRGSAFGGVSGIGASLPASGVTGFTVLEADSADAAASLLKDHPHLAANGRIEIHETLDM